MNKIKIRIVLASLSLVAGMFFAQTQLAFAADAGCYLSTTASTQKVTCTAEQSREIAGGGGDTCFLASASSGAQTAYRKVSCRTITVGARDTSGDTPVSPTNPADQTDENADPTGGIGVIKLGDEEGTHTCGRGPDNEVKVSFDFGCVGGDPSKYEGDLLNPVVDIAFAIFRFLSAGVGLVVIGSIVIAGIQYSASRGDPQATSAAIKRITNSLIALLIYIFMFAIANFIVPGGMFF